MSKTVSFVARDELAEWLEQRAEAEMKSISAVCQDIVAAEYRRQESSNTSKGGETADKGGQNQSEGGALERHPDAWYRPDGKYNFAVRAPDSMDESTKYYKTRDGAEARVLRWYEGKQVDGRSV